MSPLPVDEEALDALRSQILTEQEANRLRQREILVAERRQVVFDQIFERYASLGEKFTSLMDIIESEMADRKLHDAGILEYLEEIADRLSEIGDQLDKHEYVLILLLTEQTTLDKATQLMDLKERQENRNRQRLLEQYRKDLQRLREREARYGGEPPLELVNQIELIERKIQELVDE